VPRHGLIVIDVCAGLGIGCHNRILWSTSKLNILILIQHKETPGSKQGFALMFPILVDTLGTLLCTG
jgi:hypothetical protein